MKKKISGSKAGQFFLALNCLILAILFWLAVEYLKIDELPLITLFG